ncbi:MAG: hypothetical protein RLZZ450_7509 [Pseudomonadota bacterium]|jgi:HTH-type transcriptional regulator/antitoxin MqsA
MAKNKELQRSKSCPACGAAMRFETRPDHVEYKGQRKEFESTGWWCSACDEAIFEGPALQVAERAFVELRAEVEDVLLPEQVTNIREKLNISQREAGKLLGGGVRAFQKYESGAVPVSAPMKNLLLLLGNEPKRLQELLQLLELKSAGRRTAKPASTARRRRSS